MTRRKRAFYYPPNARFECSRCGLCCGDTSARARHILLLSKEADSISDFIRLPVEDFASRVERKAPYFFEMKKIGGKCLFLRGNGCAIYDLRPLLCRFYPFSLEADKNGTFRFQVTCECPGLGTGPFLKRLYFRRLFNEACFQHGIEE